VNDGIGAEVADMAASRQQVIEAEGNALDLVDDRADSPGVTLGSNENCNIVLASRKQTLQDVGPKESGGTSDQYAHGLWPLRVRD